MTMQRLQAVSAVLGLLLLAGAALAFLLQAPRWAGGLLALGILAVAAALLAASRGALREIRTVKANLGRAVLDVGRRSRTHQAAYREQTDQLHRRLQEIRSRLEDTAAAAPLDTVQRDLTALAADVERLRDVPGLSVWQGLADLRREGVHCLVMGPHDAESILAAAESETAFEICDPRGSTGPGVPTTPAHAVGSVLVDLDLLTRCLGTGDSAAGDTADGAAGAWETFLRWLRVEVPVAGFSRHPGQLALRAAHLSRISGGLLLPAPDVPAHPVTAGHPAGVHFTRRADVPRQRPVQVTAQPPGGGPR